MADRVNLAELRASEYDDELLEETGLFQVIVEQKQLLALVDTVEAALQAVSHLDDPYSGPGLALVAALSRFDFD